MIFKFFHIPKPRGFTFRPRFYDPEAEARKEREQRIREELGIREAPEPGQRYVPMIKGQFRGARGKRSITSAKSIQKSNIRLLVLIAILFLLVYFFFYR